MNNFNYAIVPLSYRTKESIFFSFEACLEAKAKVEKYPIPPNINEFKAQILNFYARVRPKLISLLNRKKMKRFSDIAKAFETKTSIEELDLKMCKKMLFRFSDFLDSIHITNIEFEKTKEACLYDYAN